MEILLWPLVAAGAALLLWGAWLALGKFFFALYTQPARMPIAASPADFGLEFRNIDFENDEGHRLKAWLILPPGCKPGRRLPVVITTHGYATNRSDIIERSAAVAHAGFLVFTFDWRRCGESEGDVCTGGLRERSDLRAAIEKVSSLPEADPERIAIYGFSMGAVLAILLAAENKSIKAVAADSPFASMREETRHIIRNLFLPPFLFLSAADGAFKRRFGGGMSEVDTVAAAPKISPRPLLILKGERDRVVPPWHSEKIFAAAREPKRLVVNPEGGHFDNATPETIGKEVIPFLSEALGHEAKYYSDSELTTGGMG